VAPAVPSAIVELRRKLIALAIADAGSSAWWPPSPMRYITQPRSGYATFHSPWTSCWPEIRAGV